MKMKLCDTSSTDKNQRSFYGSVDNLELKTSHYNSYHQVTNKVNITIALKRKRLNIIINLHHILFLFGKCIEQLMSDKRIC